MIFKFLFLAAFVGCVRSSVVPLHAAPLQEAIKTEYDHNPQYAYAYDVQDTNTGDFKSQHEVRSGDVVKGSYSVVDPDGTKRTVDYTADDVNGFNAVVRKEPLTNSASPIITPVVAKVETQGVVSTPLLTKIETPTPVVAKVESPIKYVSAVNVASPVKYLTAPYNVEAPIKYLSSPYNLAVPSPVKYVAQSYPQAFSVAKYVSAPVKYIPNTFPNPVAVAKLDTEVKYVANPYAEAAPVKYVASSYAEPSPVKYVSGVGPVKYVSDDSFDNQIAYATYSNPIVSIPYSTPYPYGSPYVAAYKSPDLSYATTDSYNGPIVSKVAASPYTFANYEVPQYYQTPLVAKYSSSPYNQIW